MNKIIVFHNEQDVVCGVVLVTNNKLLKTIKSDIAAGLKFSDIMTKNNLKQLDGELLQVNQ